MKQVETKNELAVRFREQLQLWCKVEHIGVLYAQLFSLKTDDELQQELEYLYTLYKGTDDYFKTDSIDCWFIIWHKSIRQCDYFNDCYKANSIDLVTDDERKEFKFLANKCRAKDFSKTEGKADNQLFNETYKSIGDNIFDLDIWCSPDIYNSLKEKEYKGLKIYTHYTMPKKYILIGKLNLN